MIQDNLPKLFEFSWSSSMKPTAKFIARYLKFLGVKKSLKRASLASKIGKYNKVY